MAYTKSEKTELALCVAGFLVSTVVTYQGATRSWKLNHNPDLTRYETLVSMKKSYSQCAPENDALLSLINKEVDEYSNTDIPKKLPMKEGQANKFGLGLLGLMFSTIMGLRTKSDADNREAIDNAYNAPWSPPKSLEEIMPIEPTSKSLEEKL